MKFKKEIESIHKKTDFKTEFAGVTELGEFKYTHGGSVRPGVEYHVHYTNDKKEVFMTGGFHNSNSKIIEKVGGSKSLFSIYTKLKTSFKQEYPKKHSPIPTDGDYGIGNFTRYFAQKSNNLNAELFEITKEDFENKNNLFRYFQIEWKITGVKSEIIRENTRTMNAYARIRGNEQLTKIVFPLQYWNPPEGSSDDIQEKLSRRKIM